MSDSFGAGGDLRRQGSGQRSSDAIQTTRATTAAAGGGGGGGEFSKRPAASDQRGRGREWAAGWARESGGSGPDWRQELAKVSNKLGVDRDDTFDDLTRLVGSKSTALEAASLASVPRSAPTGGGSGGPRRPASGAASAGGSGGTSSTQRLSSTEILNENKQRQLQLEQQESFKQHLEQRQRSLQQLQAQHSSGDELTYSAYRVETSAPEYARMASVEAGLKPAASQQQQQIKATGSGVNPFDEEPPHRAGRRGASAEQREPTSVGGGPSGFLASLMGADGSEGVVAKGAQQQQQQQQQQPPDGDESAGEEDERLEQESTRYTKVAHSGACSYNYDGGGARDQLPFYKRDIGTLLAQCRGSRKLVILIVAVALLLDNMLLTAVVPIIPAYLYKLRVVREHRDALVSSPATNKSLAGGKSGGRFGPLDTNRDGRIDEEEIEAELERRINQSLSGAQDRFSGSFFHPRVLKPRDKFGNIIENDDDDDDEAEDDDDDRDATDRNEDNEEGGVERKALRRAKVRYRRAEQSGNGGGKSSRKSSINMDDEYEPSDDDNDDDDDAADDAGGAGRKERRRDEGAMNGKMDRDKAAAPAERRTTKAAGKEAGGSASGAVASSTAAVSGGKMGRAASLAAAKSRAKSDNNDGRDTNDGDNDNDDDDDDDDKGGEGNSGQEAEDNNDQNDDDDEDMTAARNWNRLRSSLREMAERSGNDSEALGGMCLSMALDRPNYFKQRDDKSRARSRVANEANQGSRNSQARAGDDSRGRQDGQRARGRWAADGRGSGDKLSQRPRVDRLRPSRVMKNKDEEAERPGSREGDTGTTLIGDDEVIINHQDIVDESFEVGVMFASKPIVQAIANPFVGAITNRVGFTLPMFLGFTIMFLSTLVFAFGETYATLFLARAIQGVGSACTSVAGMSMIADRFPDDAERGNAMAVALGGLALGVVIGPPFGGFMYEFFGKPSPFIVLAMLALLDGLLQLLVLQPRVTKSQDEGASLMTLIKDPYILVAAGAITFANTGIGILEPALPLWMMDTMQAKNWEQGVAFLPAALSYLFSTNLFGNLGLRIGRWRSAMLGLVIIGCSLLLIPFASRVDHLILPNGAIGFAIGMVDSTMMPMLGYLVDIRHTSVYGSVYAIGDVAFCASFVFGPALSGTLVELIGFEGLIITTALICFAFAPLLVLLRDPPIRQANEAQLQEQSTLRYVNYNHLDSPDEGAKLTATGKTSPTSKSYVR